MSEQSNTPFAEIDVEQLGELLRAGNVLAELVDDYRPRSEPDCDEANALRRWDAALRALGRRCVAHEPKRHPAE